MALGPYLVACSLLILAGAAKAARPADTARALLALWPRSGAAVGLRPVAAAIRLAAAGEAVLGVVAIWMPARPWAAAVAASYAAFAAFITVAKARGGALATCGCFGKPDTPPTVLHVVLDLGLGVAATMVAANPPGRPLWRELSAQPLHGMPLLAGVALATYLTVAAMTHLGRLHAVRAELAAAGAATGGGR